MFLALKLAMGITVQPLVADQWPTDWLFETPGFAKVMSRRRFQLLSSCLHFVNNATAVRDERGRHVDPLFKVRPVLSRVTRSFRSLYHPRQQVAIDEQMIAFKGRFSFKQYLPKKPMKWGLKAFVLAESATGYVFEYDVYMGKHRTADSSVEDDEADATGTEGVVRKLVRHLGAGHRVFMDNFYSSPKLFQHLASSQRMASVGTVRINRRGLPQAVKQRVAKGDPPRFWRKGPLMALSWMDKMKVTLLSTIHDNATVSKRVRSRQGAEGFRNIVKPACVDDYNTHMGGVDRCDQLLSYYEWPHKHQKWYLTMFHRLLEFHHSNYSSFLFLFW